MFKTIALQIGNSDNKLAQKEWAAFVNAIHSAIVLYTNDLKNFDSPIHFSAPSVGWADWQNAAWVFSCKEFNIPELKERISEIREIYKQDTVAWLEGKTEFI